MPLKFEIEQRVRGLTNCYFGILGTVKHYLVDSDL